MKLSEHSTATSVYLEQMGNHIEIGEGYTQLRRHLFRELLQIGNSEIVSEDRLSDSIVTYLTGALNKSVNFHRSQHTFRILQIIEDLITYADEIMTPAMHNELFISALVNVASPKIVTFNSKSDSDCRTHALTIFAYWFNRFGREEDSNYQLFIQGYNQLKNMKLAFTTNITLKPDDYFKKQLEKQKKRQPVVDSNANPNTNRVILEDIHDFTGKTEALLKQNIKLVANTQYVRLIKHKSKVLFDFTSKPSDFNEKEKNLVKQLYKRLRVVLKEVEKIKEATLQTKQSSQAQKQYVEAKITPKKSPQTDSPISNKQKTILLETEPKQTTLGLQKKENNNLLGIEETVINKTPKKAQQAKQVDLLNDVPTQEAKPNQQQEFVDGIFVNDNNNEKKQEAAALFQVFSTPKKQVHQEESTFLAKQQSSKSNKSQDLSPSFQNEKAAKNPYSYIPDNLNLTPTSSVQDDEEKVQEKPGFSLFGLLNFGNKEQNIEKNVYDEENLPYDSPHKKAKKCSEETSVKVEFIPVELPPDAMDIVNLPNYKPVEPIRYQIYAQPVVSSPQNEDEESKFELIPKNSSEPQLEEIQMKAQKSGEKIKLSQE